MNWIGWMDSYVGETGLDGIGWWGLSNRIRLEGNVISIGC
jgi:hypothetical protein